MISFWVSVRVTGNFIFHIITSIKYCNYSYIIVVQQVLALLKYTLQAIKSNFVSKQIILALLFGKNGDIMMNGTSLKTKYFQILCVVEEQVKRLSTWDILTYII